MLLFTLAMLQQIGAQHFAPIPRPGVDPAAAARLAALCPAGAATSTVALLRLESQQAREAGRGSDPDHWSALGCTRTLLDIAGVRPRDGILMSAGEPWRNGATAAFRKVLAIRPGDARAVDVIALFAAAESDPAHLAELARITAAAVDAGVHSGPTLRGCAAFNLRIGQDSIARHCAELGLALGADSTEHLLTLARLRYRVADSAGGSALFLRAVSAAHDSLARDDITWHLQWFLAPDERRAWDNVAAPDRAAWVADRLRSRDVRDGQPPGARLAEHFKRLEYVEQAFRLRVPSVMATRLMTGNSSHDTTRFVVGGTLLDDRAYARWQVDFDDRGVIWMRFGKPLHDAVHEERGFRALPNGDRTRDVLREYETWTYQLDGEPLVLTFRYEEFAGTAAPSRLVVGHVGDVDCMAGGDWRCTLAMGGLNRANGPRLLQQDREYVAAATTSDDNSPRGEQPIGVIARLHRLWDPLSSAPIALVTYALPVKDLALTGTGAGREAVVDLEIRRWNAGTLVWQDTAITSHLAVPEGRTGKVHLTGFITFPSSTGVSSWSVVATQPGRRGRAWDVTATGLDSGAIALSDLVIGQTGQGILWNLHNAPVLLDPLNAVDHAQPVMLYYQVLSDRARPELRARVSLYRLLGPVRADTAALQVTFPQAIHAGLNELQPQLDASHLKGDYVLDVDLIDATGALLTRREVTVSIT